MKTLSTLISRLAKTLVVFCLCLILNLNVQADHIRGGELYYEYLGPNSYKITLKVFRDCDGGTIQFDNPAKITIFKQPFMFADVIEIPFTGSTTLPFTTPDTTLIPVSYPCVEVAVYSAVVTVPSSPSGYIFAYQRCCRASNIVNLFDPVHIGTTYWEAVPAAYLTNNSPKFNNQHPLVLCVNHPMSFDHSATDPDGDVLIYRLCAPKDGASDGDPWPYIATPPPYTDVTFAAPYSDSYQMLSFPHLSIDSTTGIVTVTPLGMGNFTVGVRCDEYRSGVLIGTHHSDFTYTVNDCTYSIGIETYPALKCIVFPNPTIDEVQFTSEYEININIFDLTGKMIFKTTNPNLVQHISTEGWAPGMYAYQAYSENGVTSGKLIKE